MTQCLQSLKRLKPGGVQSHQNFQNYFQIVLFIELQLSSLPLCSLHSFGAIRVKYVGFTIVDLLTATSYFINKDCEGRGGGILV